MAQTNGHRVSIRSPNPPVEDSVFKMFRMDGKTVIITGGAGGIGYEIARGLAEAGANVCISPPSSKSSINLAVSLPSGTTHPRQPAT
jgi:sorbose reductase